jgi:uncharacterized membrane protein
MSSEASNSDRTAPTAGVRPVTPILAALGVAGAVALVVFVGHGRLHEPDFTPILNASPQIQIHLAAALLAFGLGTVQMLAPKGTLPHRLMGWTWAILMMVVAIASIFIKVIYPGHFSYIHILTAWVLIATPLGVWAARRGNITAHARFMSGLYDFSLIVAGAFTFAPGRLLFQVFFGP